VLFIGVKHNIIYIKTDILRFILSEISVLFLYLNSIRYFIFILIRL